MVAPSWPSATTLAAAIRKKDVSPVEIAQAYLAEIDRLDGEINAFVWRRDEELLKEAKAAEQTIMAGVSDLPAFFGVPIPIKDLTETKGHPVTHGSRVAKNKIGAYDTTSVRRIKEAGFLIMGRTNSPEFGALPVTENLLYGATRNPWNLERTPGGSSGGAAAAVAGGMAPIAHASDGGGSIRIPASATGLVGLKASRGRIPKGPYASDIMLGFSTDGCVSRTVEDTAAMLDVLAFRDETSWYGVPEPTTAYVKTFKNKAPRLRVGFTTDSPFGLKPEQAPVDAVTRTASILAALGHDVHEAQVAWPMSPDAMARDFFTIWSTSVHYFDFPDLSALEPLTAELRKLGLALSSADYIKASLRLQVYSRKIVQEWGKAYDILLTPTLAMEPPKIGWLFATGETDPVKLLWRCSELVPYCSWCNITGQPAISLPTHVSEAGLPIGVQLVSAPYREDLLLQLGQELEDAVGWNVHLPVR